VIFGKTLTTLAAGAAVAAAPAGVGVAAAFALFAVLQPHLGAAGAAAVVAAVAAAIVGIAGLLAAFRVDDKAHHPAPAPDALYFAEKALEMVKARPILTVGAGLAAGVIAFRNPALAAIVAKALLDSQKPPPR
jgi:hypothetical protein